MNTVWGAECASHRPSRAGESANPFSPGGAALLLHPNTQRPRAGAPGPGLFSRRPSGTNDRLWPTDRLKPQVPTADFVHAIALAGWGVGCGARFRL
jgi:hypothetical protein